MSFLGKRGFISSTVLYAQILTTATARLYGRSHTKSLKKRALRFILNDYENSYERLLEKSRKSNMNLWRIRFLCIEIYITINSLKF